MQDPDIEERARLAEERARDADRRAVLLDDLGTRLANAHGTDEVARVVGDFLHEITGPIAVAIALAGRTPGKLVLVDTRRVSPEHARRFESFPEDAPYPLAKAHREQRAIFFEEIEDLRREHPELAENVASLNRRAGASLPLLAGGRSLGAIGFAFDEPRAIPDDLRHLLTSVARQAAVALDRAALLERAQRETARIRYLAHVGELLASSMRTRDILATLARYAVPELADWAAVDLFVDGGTRVDRVAIAHVDPEKMSLVEELVKRYPPVLDNPEDGLARILTTGEPQLVPEIPEELVVRATRDEEHLRIIRTLGLHSYVGVPIISRGRVRGAFTLITAESRRSYGQDDLELALEIARRASIALDIADTVAELRRAEREAKRADKRKDEFLALLGHELRNPLAAIAAATEVMSVTGATASDPASARARAAIARQVSHMKRMLDDLLDVARIARGKMAIEREPLDLREVIRHTVGDHRADFARANVVVAYELPASPLTISADRTRLAQLIANLVLNAVKFTPAGGRVTLRLRETGGHAEIEVADTGVGIDAHDLEDVFDPFVQARPTHERSKAGLGLGLALVKGLAELHGGRVRAHSDGAGKGSRFVVRLPLSGAEPAPPPEEPLSGGEPLVVLVVEDDPDGGEMLSMLVAALGHTVHLAENGPRALELARAHRPALVLCDIGLGGSMDGYAVARALRDDADAGRPLLVAVTGFGLPEHERRAATAGFDRYFTKPISRAALSEVLELARGRAAAGG